MKFLLRALAAALGLWLATYLIDGIRISGPAVLLVAALLHGLFSALVRPILIVLTLPITVLTLGLFLLVINTAVLGLVAWLLPGFEVAGFVSAFLGALVVSIVGWVASLFFK